MATKPSKPSGDYTLKTVTYAQDGKIDPMSNLEFQQGRNNTGEAETLLGSMTNAHKDNYMFAYLTKHIDYIEKMLDYILEKGGW